MLRLNTQQHIAHLKHSLYKQMQQVWKKCTWRLAYHRIVDYWPWWMSVFFGCTSSAICSHVCESTHCLYSSDLVSTSSWVEYLLPRMHYSVHQLFAFTFAGFWAGNIQSFCFVKLKAYWGKKKGWLLRTEPNWTKTIRWKMAASSIELRGFQIVYIYCNLRKHNAN